jgi:hypothetical protein
LFGRFFGCLVLAAAGHRKGEVTEAGTLVAEFLKDRIDALLIG